MPQPDNTVQSQPAAQLLAPTEVAKRTSMSWRTVRRLIRDDQFPRPIRISAQRVAFLEHEVKAWIDSRPRLMEVA